MPITSARPSRSTKIGDAQVLLLERLLDVHQQHHDLGEADRVDRVGDRKLFELLLNLRRRRSPAVSCRRNDRVRAIAVRPAMESRVMPASGPVSRRSSPSSRLTSVDLPAVRPADDGDADGARLRPRLGSSSALARRRRFRQRLAQRLDTDRPGLRHARPRSRSARQARAHRLRARRPCPPCPRSCWRPRSPACRSGARDRRRRGRPAPGRCAHRSGRSTASACSIAALVCASMRPGEALGARRPQGPRCR